MVPISVGEKLRNLAVEVAQSLVHDAIHLERMRKLGYIAASEGGSLGVRMFPDAVIYKDDFSAEGRKLDLAKRLKLIVHADRNQGAEMRIELQPGPGRGEESSVTVFSVNLEKNQYTIGNQMLLLEVATTFPRQFDAAFLRYLCEEDMAPGLARLTAQKAAQIETLRQIPLKSAACWARVPELAERIFEELDGENERIMPLLRCRFYRPRTLLGAAVNGQWRLAYARENFPAELQVILKESAGEVGLLEGPADAVEKLLLEPELVDGFHIVTMLEGILAESRQAVAS